MKVQEKQTKIPRICTVNNIARISPYRYEIDRSPHLDTSLISARFPRIQMEFSSESEDYLCDSMQSVCFKSHIDIGNTSDWYGVYPFSVRAFSSENRSRISEIYEGFLISVTAPWVHSFNTRKDIKSYLQYLLQGKDPV